MANLINIPFPDKGVSGDSSLATPTPGTCFDALNVSPFGVVGDRKRGGTRSGTSKYYSTQHNGSNAIQRITSDSSVAPLTSSITESFTHADAPFWSAYPRTWDHLVSDLEFASTTNPTFGDVITADSESPAIVSNEIKVEAIGTERSSVHIYTGQSVSLTGNYTLSCDIQCTGDEATVRDFIFVILFRVNPAYNDEFYGVRFLVSMYSAAAGVTAYLIKGNGSGYDAVDIETTGGFKLTTRNALLAGATLVLSITSAGVVSLDWGTLPGGVVTFGTAMDAYASYSGVGFGVYNGVDEVGGQETSYFDNFAIGGLDPPASNRIFKILSLSGGDVYSGTPTQSLTLATNGTDVTNASGRVDMQPAFGKVYIVDGDPAHYSVWDKETDTVSTWTPTSGTLPMGSTETAVSITAATPATPSFTVAEDWSGRSAGDYLLVAGSTGNDGYYTIASTSGSGPTILTVNETVADATGDGTIQYQNKGCTIAKLYRGRLKLGGLATDPQNWFMSEANDPLNWDYGATPSAIIAVAGNNSVAGKVGDIITCIAPYSDDLCLLGGDHTLWLMRGDPADNGRIDNVSYQTGISGPNAYTFDPGGTCYFFGAETLWRMQQNSQPEPLSRNRMDRLFGAINLQTHDVVLAWDNTQHGLFMFTVPLAEGSTTHYYWDQRTDSFWLLQFPDAQGPTAVYAFDGDSPTDKALMLGGWDGYIRYLDSDATTDDGTDIASHVTMWPMYQDGQRAKVTGLNSILPSASGAVTVGLYGGKTQEEALGLTNLLAAASLTAGTQRISRRVSSEMIAIRLSSDGTLGPWATEKLTVDLQPAGKTRRSNNG